jgi:hypothetical protein
MVLQECNRRGLRAAEKLFDPGANVGFLYPEIPELLPIGRPLKSRSAVGTLFFAASAGLFHDLARAFLIGSAPIGRAVTSVPCEEWSPIPSFERCRTRGASLRMLRR